VVRLTPADPWPADEYARFLTVVKNLFQQRRKQLASSLRARYDLDDAEVADLAGRVGFDPAQRPEQLDAACWRRLAAALPGEPES
jgi:16S rRNA A1518/A1519 N6-dimethyltransferase RsmA/KsgA/DIM1 with predicted DNA glycosylase/AP lyase activity